MPRSYVFNLQSREVFVKLPTSISELYAPEFLALAVVATKVAVSSGRQPTVWLNKCCLCLRPPMLRGVRPVPTSSGALYAPEFLSLIVVTVKVAESSDL